MLMFVGSNYNKSYKELICPLLCRCLLHIYLFFMCKLCPWRAGLVQAVESYRLWPEGPRFESRSPRIAQARVRLATNTLPQTPHRAWALCTEYALYVNCVLEPTCSCKFWDLCFIRSGLLGICVTDKGLCSLVPETFWLLSPTWISND